MSTAWRSTRPDQPDRALEVLAAAHARHPGNREILFALATFSAKARNRPAAIGYARRLLELNPQDPEAKKFLEELTSPQPPGVR